MPRNDLQYYPQIIFLWTMRPPTTQQANWQPPIYPCASPTREEVDRFDRVLEEILRQKEIAGQHAARQAITRIQHEEIAKKVEAAEKAELNQASVTQDQSYTQASFCSHQVWWTPVPGRSRCEYHSYVKNAYRNSSRFRCTKCRTIACGLCRKKLKRGDML